MENGPDPDPDNSPPVMSSCFILRIPCLLEIFFFFFASPLLHKNMNNHTVFCHYTDLVIHMKRFSCDLIILSLIINNH